MTGPSAVPSRARATRAAPDAPVVLLAHGSPDPRHGEGVDALATRLGALVPDREVVSAYLDHHGPTPAQVGRSLPGGVVVPVLLTPAYHARVDVPEAVAAMGAARGRDFVAAAPLGPHPMLLDAAAELLAAAGRVPDPAAAVVLYAAGSSESAAVGSVERTLAEHPPAGTPGWGPWAVAALDGGRRLPAVLAGLRSGTAPPDRVLAAAFTVAEGVLRDRMADRCAEHGVELVPGALGHTEALARLALLRAEAC